MKQKFGVTIEKRSFEEFGKAAKQVSDQEAREVWENWDLETPGVSDQALLGDVTLTKLDHTFSRLMTVSGKLVDYVQYPGSDCRNGAVVRIRDAHKLMDSFYSHHILLVSGHWEPQISNLVRVFNLELDEF